MRCSHQSVKLRVIGLITQYVEDIINRALKIGLNGVEIKSIQSALRQFQLGNLLIDQDVLYKLRICLCKPCMRLNYLKIKC